MCISNLQSCDAHLKLYVPEIINCHHPFDCRVLFHFTKRGERAYLCYFTRGVEGIARAE